MRMLLAITVLFLLATDVLQWDLTYSAGLSAKNGVLYLITVFLLLRIVTGRAEGSGARPMYAAFAILIGYALLSWVIAGVLIRYPTYDLVESGIRLKNYLVDPFTFFLVFFLGTRSSEDTMTVIKALLLGAIFANLMTVLDVSGVLDLNYVERADGRTQGALGESNQYAAFIILFLPALICAMGAARGLRRLFWLGGALISVVALLLTASRGAMVGLLVASAMGVYMYRRHVSVGRLSAWIIGGAAVIMILLSVSQSDQLLTERVLTQTGSIDLSDASSGRSEIWSDAVAQMLHAPVTLLTGYGWDVYSAFPFRYAPHNHYLGLWFNLGLVGLAAGSFVLFYAIVRARRASDVAPPPLRGQLIGFVIGATALCVAIFFVDLHKPWPYFWAYVGVALRLAACIPQAAHAPVEARVAPAGDAHGWVARATASKPLKT